LRDGGRAAAREEIMALDGVKAFVLANPGVVRDDPAVLSELGLRLDAANIIDFGPVALSRMTAARQREFVERSRLEAIAEANHAAQAQTHAAALDLVGAIDLADLAARIAGAARRRFDLAGGVLALEGPGAVPAGWTALAKGQVDLILGARRRTRLGHSPTARGLFRREAGAVASVALLRLGVWKPKRAGVLALGATDPDAFTADMGTELLTFLARIIERTAERWPAP